MKIYPLQSPSSILNSQFLKTIETRLLKVSGISVIVLLFLTVQLANAQNVGIGTTAPNSKLDVNGSFSIREGTAVALTNGANANVTPLGNFSFYRITGPTASFSISGIIGGVDGKLLTLVNSTGQSMRILNQNTGSITANQINTLNGNDLVLQSGGVVNLQYNANLSKWVVTGNSGADAPNTAQMWNINGTSSTNSGTNFIGTTDNVSLRFRTNNTQKMVIDSTGNVGVGTATATSTMDVNGTERIRNLPGGSSTDSIVTTDANGNIHKRSITSILTGATTHTLSSAANTITSTVNGVAATASAVNTVANTSSGNNLTTTVNGVAATVVPMVNTISNTSSANTLSTTVNGVVGSTVNIINSHSLSLSGTNLTSTTNGVATTALDLTPAILSKAWSLTGNAGTNSGTNFIGTTDNVSYRLRTNNTERMVVDSLGKVGIGTTTPGSTLDVKGTLRLSGSTSGYVGFTAPAAAGSTTYTLPSADGTNSQVLSTNGSGTLSWTSIKGSFGVIGAGSNIPGTATATYYNTGSYIALPPGKYMVSVYMILSPNSFTTSEFNTKTTPGTYWVKSFFADTTQGVTAGATMSPILPQTNVSPDVVGNGKLISGAIMVSQQYSPLAGSVVINNTSGVTKKYYYWAGWVQNNGSLSTSNTIWSFGGINFGEDNIVAFPVY